MYADSSALVKLVIEEPESHALEQHLGAETMLATSRIALVEVTRATAIANRSAAVRAETWRQLDACLLVNLTDGLLRAAAALASLELRTLDAIHLESARRIEPDEVVAYDARLLDAATGLGLAVAHPGLAR